MCFSACVYALVGAAVRELAPGVRLGIHSSSFTFADDERAFNRTPTRMMRDTIEASYRRLADYFNDMGIDPALVAAAREISNDRIRVLTRDEIWRFKIDRRGFVEDVWKLSDPATPTIRKLFVTERAGHTEFRDAMVNLTCQAPDQLRVDVALERVPGDADEAAGVRLVAGGIARVLTPNRRMMLGGSRTEYEVMSADIRPAFFLDAGGSINVSAAVRPSASVATLSTAGLRSALAKLLPLCGMSARPQLEKSHEASRPLQ
jgi:hypothetical protein